MRRKQQLLVDIRVCMSALGSTLEQIEKETKAYHRKTIAELEVIWTGLFVQARARGLIRS